MSKEKKKLNPHFLCNIAVDMKLFWGYFSGGRNGTAGISWPIRMKIALGAARGVAFLHNAETGVIYRDFKAANILLDDVSSSQTAQNFSINLWYSFRDISLTSIFQD